MISSRYVHLGATGIHTKQSIPQFHSLQQQTSRVRPVVPDEDRLPRDPGALCPSAAFPLSLPVSLCELVGFPAAFPASQTGLCSGRPPASPNRRKPKEVQETLRPLVNRPENGFSNSNFAAHAKLQQKGGNPSIGLRGASFHPSPRRHTSAPTQEASRDSLGAGPPPLRHQ